MVLNKAFIINIVSFSCISMVNMVKVVSKISEGELFDLCTVSMPGYDRRLQKSNTLEMGRGKVLSLSSTKQSIL